MSRDVHQGLTAASPRVARGAVGFMGAVMVRRIVGIAHVADMESIAGGLRGGFRCALVAVAAASVHLLLPCAGGREKRLMGAVQGGGMDSSEGCGWRRCSWEMTQAWLRVSPGLLVVRHHLGVQPAAAALQRSSWPMGCAHLQPMP